MRARDQTPQRDRLPLIDAVRAVLASTIAWHHFIIYGPLAESAPPEFVDSLQWLRNYRWVVQAFFVVGGFVMARAMTPRRWDVAQVVAFVARRYVRLGLPYLAAIALAVGASSLARGSLPEEVIGTRPTWQQLLAHVFFLQDILGYPSLSAGLWFVCIDFQLSLLFVALLYFRDLCARLAGNRERAARWAYFAPSWMLAVASLFYFNTDARFDVWALYYFAYFFLGMLLAEVSSNRQGDRQFAALLLLMSAALAVKWRWRLLAALLTGTGLYVGIKLDLIGRWPASRVLGYLGRTSYSLFLVHYPVLIVVETLWLALGWTSPMVAVAGLIAAYLASLLVADVFFRAVETPAVQLSTRCKL